MEFNFIPYILYIFVLQILQIVKVILVFLHIKPEGYFSIGITSIPVISTYTCKYPIEKNITILLYQ